MYLLHSLVFQLETLKDMWTSKTYGWLFGFRILEIEVYLTKSSAQNKEPHLNDWTIVYSIELQPGVALNLKHTFMWEPLIRPGSDDKTVCCCFNMKNEVTRLSPQHNTDNLIQRGKQPKAWQHPAMTSPSWQEENCCHLYHFPAIATQDVIVKHDHFVDNKVDKMIN